MLVMADRITGMAVSEIADCLSLKGSAHAIGHELPCRHNLQSGRRLGFRTLLGAFAQQLGIAPEW